MTMMLQELATAPTCGSKKEGVIKVERWAIPSAGGDGGVTGPLPAIVEREGWRNQHHQAKHELAYLCGLLLL